MLNATAPVSISAMEAAAVHAGRGIYRTEDAGKSWERLMDKLPRWYTIGM